MKTFIKDNFYFVKRYHLFLTQLLVHWMNDSLSEHFYLLHLPAQIQLAKLDSEFSAPIT